MAPIYGVIFSYTTNICFVNYTSNISHIWINYTPTPNYLHNSSECLSSLTHMLLDYVVILSFLVSLKLRRFHPLQPPLSPIFFILPLSPKRFWSYFTSQFRQPWRHRHQRLCVDPGRQSYWYFCSISLYLRLTGEFVCGFRNFEEHRGEIYRVSHL